MTMRKKIVLPALLVAGLTACGAPTSYLSTADGPALPTATATSEVFVPAQEKGVPDRVVPADSPEGQARLTEIQNPPAAVTSTPSATSVVDEPTPIVPPVEAPREEPAPPPVYYRNCDDVRAHGKAPIRPGDPGFREVFDGDRDGIGCE